MKRVLLVQPGFPIPPKSLNHKDYLPVGLLKLANYHKRLGDEVALGIGEVRTDFRPDDVYVTSLFTYWASHVRDAVRTYRGLFPEARITVGGIYASLAPDHCREYTGCDEVFTGVHQAAEECGPDYSLVDTPFQIIHASRGCTRRCRFCGTYEIEPDFEPKRSIANEIVKNHLVFYDNNLLANPYIAGLLREMAAFRVNGRVVTSESQSGLDGRFLLDHPHLARLLKDAHFRTPRIAWDGTLEEADSIRRQLDVLKSAGFAPKDTQVFMLYNHELPPDVLMSKVEQCFEWGVQVSDCRFRPLDRFEDGYRPYRSSQDPGEYYLHSGWTDAHVRGLRREVRANNICVRYRIPRSRYSKALEQLSGNERRRIALRLGIEKRRYTLEELDAINRQWAEDRGTAETVGAQRRSPLDG